MQTSNLKAEPLIACCLLRREMEMQAQSTDNGAGSGQLQEMPGTYPHFGLAVLLLYGMNTGLSKFTQTAGIQFPSALIGTVPQSTHWYAVLSNHHWYAVLSDQVLQMSNAVHCTWRCFTFSLPVTTFFAGSTTSTPQHPC